MAIVSIRPSFDQTYKESKQATDFTRRYIIVVDSIDDDAVFVRTGKDPTTGLFIPQRGDPHPSDSKIKVGDVSIVKEQGATKNFVATVLWKTPDGKETEPFDTGSISGQGTGNLDFEWSTVTVTEPVDRDVNGKPIMNTAGEFFDPPLTKDFHDSVLSIARDQTTWNQNLVTLYLDTVNRGDAYGFKHGEGRLVSMNARQQDDGTWRAQYQIQFRTGGWAKRILNAGFRELFNNGQADPPGLLQLRNILDSRGDPVARPWPLKENGQALSLKAVQDINAGKVKEPVRADPVFTVPGTGSDTLFWLNFQLYPLSDYVDTLKLIYRI